MRLNDRQDTHYVMIAKNHCNITPWKNISQYLLLRMC